MLPDHSLAAIRQRLDDITYRGMLVYEAVCLILFFLMLFITLIQIGNRLIPFDHPWELRWTVAWSVRMMLFTSFLGIGLVHYHRNDIEIHVFKDWLKERYQSALGTLYQLILDISVLLILGVLTYVSTTFGFDLLNVSPAPTFFACSSRGTSCSSWRWDWAWPSLPG
jgi:TRAP-type C4-dicarboxylate transport system permease small subunit